MKPRAYTWDFPRMREEDREQASARKLVPAGSMDRLRGNTGDSTKIAPRGGIFPITNSHFYGVQKEVRRYPHSGGCRYRGEGSVGTTARDACV